MKEHLTEAIVLDIRPIKGNDRLVDLYSKSLGRLKVRVIAGRKLISKLSPHLDPLNIVTVRLIEKNSLTLADVVTDNRLRHIRSSTLQLSRALKLLYLLRSLLFIKNPDLKLWYWLKHSLNNNRINYREVLKILGYDPLLAQCQICDSPRIDYFYITDQSFLCDRCHFKLPTGKVIYIG